MKSTDPQATFWQWFQSNIDRFNRFEEDQQRLMHELSTQLHQIDDNLVYEISSANSGTRELVISADGIKESFPSVVALTKAAPDIMGWTITSFRPRVDIAQFTLRYDGRDLAAKDYYFWLQPEGEHIDLILFIPDLSEDNRNEFVNSCYVLLDMALGEYDVITKIRYIDHQPLKSTTDMDGLKPLTELPKEFDELHAKLQQAVHNNGLQRTRR